jgi:DUF917 family protein
LREARLAHRDPVAEVSRQLAGRIIFTGKVTDVFRRNAASILSGVVILRSTEF